MNDHIQDDERLATILSEYSKGAMLTGEVKKELIGILQVTHTKRECFTFVF